MYVLSLLLTTRLPWIFGHLCLRFSLLFSGLKDALNVVFLQNLIILDHAQKANALQTHTRWGNSRMMSIGYTLVLYTSQLRLSYLDDFRKDNVFRVTQVHRVLFSVAHGCGQCLDQDLTVNLVVMSDLWNDFKLSNVYKRHPMAGWSCQMGK